VIDDKAVTVRLVDCISLQRTLRVRSQRRALKPSDESPIEEFTVAVVAVVMPMQRIAADAIELADIAEFTPTRSTGPRALLSASGPGREAGDQAVGAQLDADDRRAPCTIMIASTRHLTSHPQRAIHRRIAPEVGWRSGRVEP